MTKRPALAPPPVDQGGQSPAPRIFYREMNATLVEVRQALSALRERFDGSAGADVLDRLELVLAEVLNNIALHGSDGQPAAGALAVDGMPDEQGWPAMADACTGETGAGGPGAWGAGQRPICIRLTVTQRAGGLACAVVDNGTPLPETCLARPGVPTSPEVAALRAGGFGWPIIRELTRRLSYFRENDQNVLCFDIPACAGRDAARRAMGA